MEAVRARWVPCRLLTTGSQIPTVIIADIDLLKSYSEFSGVYSALGGDPSAVQSLFNAASTQLGDQGAVLSVAEFAV